MSAAGARGPAGRHARVAVAAGNAAPHTAAAWLVAPPHLAVTRLLLELQQVHHAHVGAGLLGCVWVSVTGSCCPNVCTAVLQRGTCFDSSLCPVAAASRWLGMWTRRCSGPPPSGASSTSASVGGSNAWAAMRAVLICGWLNLGHSCCNLPSVSAMPLLQSAEALKCSHICRHRPGHGGLGPHLPSHHPGGHPPACAGAPAWAACAWHLRLSRSGLSLRSQPNVFTDSVCQFPTR